MTFSKTFYKPFFSGHDQALSFVRKLVESSRLHNLAIQTAVNFLFNLQAHNFVLAFFLVVTGTIGRHGRTRQVSFRSYAGYLTNFHD